MNFIFILADNPSTMPQQNPNMSNEVSQPMQPQQSNEMPIQTEMIDPYHLSGRNDHISHEELVDKSFAFFIHRYWKSRTLSCTR